ncbi:hypothetical protein QBC40DRAFT_289887 [Triangularia verruculosa]|uniref:Wax synthase domain-containing protein n=1 Tax=Triangularia verruculosa TaxID=2587418 RepID=A0AAN6XA84_9PEZI|nr:hypothetical protein QBC40DRAFT_289887 [Triangularia verruculosa]
MEFGLLTRLLLLFFLTLARAAGNGDDGTVSEKVGWQSEPNGRGTFSLIFSCVVTLTLCVFSALHLNVPPESRSNSFRLQFLDKTKWVLYGIFAPELVVATAAAQFIIAAWLKKEIDADVKSRNGNGQVWDITQCFYAVMGGFAVDLTDFVGIDADGRPKRFTITPEGVRLLSFLGDLPTIQESQIRDKSKADWLAKSIVCAQAGWMVIQVIGRAAKHMPISLLEINTCGHVACAFVIYLLWWHKPLDILVPTLLPVSDEMKEALALMHLCSPQTSGTDEHGIMDIRCFVHVAEGEDDERVWKLPESYPSPVLSSAEQTPTIAAENDGQEMSELRTHLSIGSPGSRDPAAFLGFGQLWSESDTKKKSTTRNSSYRYQFNLNAPSISPQCLAYFRNPYDGFSIRHSRYCRRGFPDAQQPSVSPRPLIPPAVLQTASRAADRLRSLCAQRPEYQPYYFTLGFGPKLAHFFGETDYLVPHIVNFPSLHKLSLGQVNIHRDRLRAVLAATAAAYGALHCSAGFNNFETFSFVTEVEKTLWVYAALTITVSGVLLWGFFSARQYWPAFDAWVSGVNPAMPITLTGKEGRQQGKWVRFCRTFGVYVVLGCFVLARVYLVFEAVVSLRSALRGLYETPEWTDFLPHL